MKKETKPRDCLYIRATVRGIEMNIKVSKAESVRISKLLKEKGFGWRV